jgi:hypothetical protein
MATSSGWIPVDQTPMHSLDTDFISDARKETRANPRACALSKDMFAKGEAIEVDITFKFLSCRIHYFMRISG